MAGVKRKKDRKKDFAVQREGDRRGDDSARMMHRLC